MLNSRWCKLLARFVYGFMLPFGLLYVALLSHYSLVRERQIAEWREKMSASLDQISKYHVDDKFFHGVFQSAFRQVDRAEKPLAACFPVVKKLRRQFSGKLKFVFYDAAGNIVRELSDENRFQYVFRAMYQVIDRVFTHVAEVVIPNPERLEVVQQRISLLRGYFGQFLMEKHLSLPFLEGYLGSCIRASEEADKSLLWFQHYRNFSVVVFVHKDLVGQHLGPRMLTDDHNRNDPSCRLGFFDTQKLTLYGVNKDHSEITIQAGSYADSAVEFVKSDNYLLFFRHLSPRLIVFALVDQRVSLLDPEAATLETMLGLFRWLLVIAFIIFCLHLRFADLSLSVRQKLLLLFLFANGLPMLILAATAYEFFEQKKNSLLNAAHDQSVRIIKEFDNGYPAGREKMARQISEYVKDKNREFGAQAWPAEEIEQLRKFILSFNPGESYLYDRQGTQLMYTGKEATMTTVKIIRDFFKGCLEFFNSKNHTFVSNKRTVLEKITEDAWLYAGVLDQLGKISPQNFGSGIRWTYLELLGDRSKHDSWGFLIVSWRSADLQRTFLEQHLHEVNRQISPRQLLVMEKGSEVIFPVHRFYERSLRNLMHRTQTRKLIEENNLVLNDRSCVATSLVGIELSDAVITALYPASLIFAEVEHLYHNVLLAALVSLCVVLVIVRFFSGRLLRPVNAISHGMRSIARRDFKYRVDYDSGDEFGELTTAFNSAIAGMQELSLGTAIQESLLPGGKERFGNVTLFARSIFMTKMGGDYYDYYQIENNRLGVYFGDVAGHGIPAALAMAMAKAVVATATDARVAGPAELLQNANTLFLHLKSRGWKRMMTALSLDIDFATGEFRVANAGQCFPALIANDSEKVKYIKAVGMPLGSLARRPYQELAGRLQPGDTLVLYSDGIIEALNAEGEVFDFSRFEKLLLATRHHDLEKWWEGIYRGYCAWAATQDDDITFLMLRFDYA